MRTGIGLGISAPRGRLLDPRSLMPGLKSWYGGAATVASNLVSSWTDLSGNGFHATEVTAKPTWVTGAQNGRPVVRFAGAQKLSSAYGSTIAQPACYLIVCKCNGAAGETIIDGIDGTNRNLVYHNATTTVASFAGAQIAGTPTAVGSMTTYLVVINGASSVIRANGSQIASGNVGAEGVAGLKIGISEAGTNFLSGDIAGLVHWIHAPTAIEIARAEQWARAEFATW